MGTGAVGEVIARHLVQSSGIDHLDLGDIDPVRARAIAAKAGSKATPLAINAGDRRELGSALKGKDLVINASLPNFNISIMKTALERGVDYVDLAGEGDQLGLHPKFAKAGLTAVLGVGEDPGISNVFARHAADGMDRLEAIRIRDGETSVSDEFPFMCLFSPEVFIGEGIGDAALFSEGKFQRLPSMSNPEDFPFPDPVGVVPVYQMDHDEVHTLPRYIGKGVRFVDFKLALLPDTAEVLRVIKRLGLMSEEAMNVKGVKVRPKDFLLSLIPPPAALAGRVQGHAVVLVEVTGTKDGVRRVHTLWSAMPHGEAGRRYGCTATSYLTGSGAAAGALMVVRDHWNEPGVFPPEAMPAQPFMEALRGLGVEVRESVSVTRQVL